MDKNVIFSLKIGKRKAFEEIFNSFFPALCNFANNYINDTQIAEDLVQDVFIALWDYREKFEDLLSLKSFLYKSVRNKCLNFIKHQKVSDKYNNAIANELEDELIYSDHIIEEETHRLIYNAINELPANCKKILLLSMNGLSNPEIANDLNISVNTVKTQKAIAYKQLRIKLKVFFIIFGITFGIF